MGVFLLWVGGVCLKELRPWNENDWKQQQKKKKEDSCNRIYRYMYNVNKLKFNFEYSYSTYLQELSNNYINTLL